MRQRTLPVVLGAMVLASCQLCSQSSVPPDNAPVTDPPGRVARLSYLSGPVSFQAAASGEWTAAVLNRPLTTGDGLWTDTSARAELDLGHAAIRLDERTSLGFLNLDDYGVQVRISEGVTQVRLRRLEENDEFELDTPNAAVSLLRPGDYRINVSPDGQETAVIARSGQAEVTTPGQAFTVRAGQRATIRGIETTSYQITAAPVPDRFDDFCQTRDRRAERAVSLQYVSPYVVGYDDLDQYGYWNNYPDYGWMWTPRVVAAGWAPYRFGHWVWIEPWGWTWVDDAPWGFAPFHYGRWLFLNTRWWWVPGPLRIRPIYAPALVVFIGGGPGLRYYFRVGVGLGVAWFPLGPREVYIPPYRVSRRYVTDLNVSGTIVANRDTVWKVDPAQQRYRNRAINGAVTAVRQDVFAGGRDVGRSAVRVTPQEVASARIGGTAPPVTPTRGSLTAAPQPGRAAPRPPAAAVNREVVVRRAPPAARVPFERQAPVLERDPGRPPDAGSLDQLRRQQPTPAPQYRRLPAQTPQTGQQPGPARTAPAAPRTVPQPRAPQARPVQPAPAPRAPVATPQPRAPQARPAQPAPAQRAPAAAPQPRAPQARPAQPAPAQRAPAAAPQPRTQQQQQRQPQRVQPPPSVPQQSPRQVEDRRRTIERERQQPARGQPPSRTK